MEERPSSIEQSCFWFQFRKNEEVNAQLDGDTSADITIIGGGFTGLWSAYFLKQLDPSVEIVLLEKETIGYGASGRNGGMVMPGMDHCPELQIEHFGEDEARRMTAVGEKNLSELASFISDCDYEPTGLLSVALTSAHLEKLREVASVGTSIGARGYKLLSAEEAQAEIKSPLYLGALFIPGGGIVNPMKVVLKLKRECEKAGIKIYERTEVTRLGNEKVQTSHGSVRSKRTVLATDAYTHHLVPQLLQKFLPLYDYIIVSESLSEEQLQKIGWKNRQGVADGRTFFNYYRLTHDNRILWGTSAAKYYGDVKTAYDTSAPYRESLLRSFTKHFPQLADVCFPFSWGGPIAATTRLTPCFGSLHEEKIFYALGYTGEGIANSRLAGNILAHMALSKQTDLLDLALVKKSPRNYPPEPFRSFAVKMVTRAMEKVDDGEKPGALLHMLDRLHIGFSS